MDAQQQPPPNNLPESEEEQEKVIKLLEERLEAHDKNRKVVQGKLTETLNRLTGQIDNLEERINKELEEKFVFEEDRLQRALNELRENGTDSALQEAKRELYTIQSYEIIENRKANNDITTLYELKTERRTVHDGHAGLAISGESSSIHSAHNTTEKGEILCGSGKFAEERERLVKLLEERLQTHDCSREAVQDKLHEICRRLRVRVDELENRASKELEDKFTSEDNRLQAALNELRGNRTVSVLQKAKVELLVEQSYEVIENKKVKHDLTTLYELKAERRIVPELMEMRKPTNVRVAGVNRGSVSVQFACLNPDEEKVLSDNAIVNPVKYKCILFKKDNEQENKEYPLGKNEDNDSSSFFFTPDTLEAETTYGIRVKIVTGDRESEWCDEIAELTTPEFKECCVWKKCPEDVFEVMKYVVDEKNPRIATKVNKGFYAIIGNTSIPLNKVTSWSIKVLKSRNNDGGGIDIGIAPFDINQNIDDNSNKCGWYFACYSSDLLSGPPHNYGDKEYGPRKWHGQYVHTGDRVGVVMDTTKGYLSFVLNGVNHGIAYEGIPLDKPLAPCVLLGTKGDSVELDVSGIKENVDNSIPVPLNITKGITWDSITLTWDEVEDASFYQVEVDESKSWYAPTTNLFVKGGLFPETEHSFRVRTVRGGSVSEWSDVVKGRTLKAPEFSECVWKKCPDDIYDFFKYSVDEKNPRVATKVNDGGDRHGTIIGNTHIPLNTVTSWSIKILKSKDNNGNSILIGIAPNDINQNDDDNYEKCGWYFYCYYSMLYSGPPHNYDDKEYGPRKEGGQYVHIGDSVGVVVDTTKGDISFVLDGANLGVAYKGIPLDKPLVPCVLLWLEGDFIELIT